MTEVDCRTYLDAHEHGHYVDVHEYGYCVDAHKYGHFVDAYEYGHFIPDSASKTMTPVTCLRHRGGNDLEQSKRTTYGRTAPLQTRILEGTTGMDGAHRDACQVRSAVA